MFRQQMASETLPKRGHDSSHFFIVTAIIQNEMTFETKTLSCKLQQLQESSR